MTDGAAFAAGVGYVHAVSVLAVDDTNQTVSFWFNVTSKWTKSSGHTVGEISSGQRVVDCCTNGSGQQ